MKDYTFSILIILLFMAMATSLEANAANEEVAICDNCYTTNSFKNIASTFPDNTYVVVFNRESGEAKRFSVFFEPDFGKMVFEHPLTQKQTKTIEDYKEVKRSFNYLKLDPKYNSANGYLSSSIDVNGCGVKDGVDVPDFIYTDACNNHDMCYAQGTAKSVCDETLYKEMDIITLKYLSDNAVVFDGLLAEVIMFAFLKDVEAAFELALNNSEKSIEAYCNAVPDRTTNSECINFDNALQNESGEHIAESTYTESTSGPSAMTITFDCELWRFMDGNGGYYYMYRNCTVRTYTMIK